MVDVPIFIKKLGQSWYGLTFKKSYMHYIMARREYILITIYWKEILRQSSFPKLWKFTHMYLAKYEWLKTPMYCTNMHITLFFCANLNWAFLALNLFYYMYFNLHNRHVVPLSSKVYTFNFLGESNSLEL
jgi:hypothetical protein